MSAIVLLLIASISVAAIFLGAFIWSVRNGQFDDDFSPPQRILFDNPPPKTTTDK
ncbi:cbb3-type cytochrome oxidase assembly protein CcoS [Longitalea luteola]|uniref:cbb3-type cytochrome oxidase assembly protein CcoS n=1 Tax=Longitalea luteola TaxID=2812563 RepID=UPI001A964D15|nr:cbb3-type cytochrome oxidase assembly protein CcoS [Longitalea luteola]